MCFSISPPHQNDRKITLPGKLIAKYNFWQRKSFRQEELDPESDCAGLRDALQQRWMLPLPLIMGWRPQISANGNFCPQHGLTSSRSLLVLGFSQVQRTKEERRGWWRARHRGSSGLGEKSPWKSQNGLGWEGPEGPLKNKGGRRISVPSEDDSGRKGLECGFQGSWHLQGWETGDGTGEQPQVQSLSHSHC